MSQRVGFAGCPDSVAFGPEQFAFLYSNRSAKPGETEAGGRGEGSQGTFSALFAGSKMCTFLKLAFYWLHFLNRHSYSES